MSITVYNFPDKESMNVRLGGVGFDLSRRRNAFIGDLVEAFSNRQRVAGYEFADYWIQNGTSLFSNEEMMEMCRFLFANNTYFCNLVISLLWDKIGELIHFDQPFESAAPEVPPERVDKLQEIDLSSMTVKQLRTFAEMNGIDLGVLTKKSDIIDRISRNEATL